jgi:DNA-binding transcriptional regulator YhcF (GntR family)
MVKRIEVRVSDEMYLMLKESGKKISEVVRAGIEMYFMNLYGRERYLQLLEERREEAIKIELKEALEFVKTHAANKDEAKTLFKQKVEEITRKLKVSEEAIRKVYEELRVSKSGGSHGERSI